MPAFDPSKPFTKVPDAAPVFDPSKPFSKVAEPDSHDIIPFLKHTASSVWEGAKGAAGAAADAAMHPLDTASDLANWMVMGGGPAGQETVVGERALRSVPLVGPAYDNVRALADPNYLADTAKEDAQHAKDHPTLDKAQRLAGTAAGLTVGALPGIGAFSIDAYHRSRLAGNDVETALKDGRNTALLLGGTEAAMAGLKAGAKAVNDAGAADAVHGLAEEKAFKAAVGNQAKAYDEAAAKGVINKRGREMLDSGVVGFGDSAQNISDKAGAQKAATWKKIEGVFKDIDESKPEGIVSGKNMADELRSYADSISGSGNKELVSRLRDAADDLEKEGNMTLTKAQVHKNSWKYEPGKAVSKEVSRKVKGIIGNEMQNAIGRMAEEPAQSVAQAAPAAVVRDATSGAEVAAVPPVDPISAAVNQAGASLAPAERQALADSMKAELGGTTTTAPAAKPGLSPREQKQLYEDLLSQYGTNAAAEKDALVKANRYAKNNAFSPGDKVAAIASAAINPHGAVWKAVTGAAGGLANKLIRKRGDSAAAVGLDKLGDLVESSPELLGKYAAPLAKAAAIAPQNLEATHQILSEIDPNYPASVNKAVDAGLAQKAAGATINGVPMPASFFKGWSTKTPNVATEFLRADSPLNSGAEVVIDDPTMIQEIKRGIDATKDMTSVEKAKLLTEIHTTGQIKIRTAQAPQPTEQKVFGGRQGLDTLLKSLQNVAGPQETH